MLDTAERAANPRLLANALVSQVLVTGLMDELQRLGVLGPESKDRIYGFGADVAVAASNSADPEARQLGTDILKILEQLQRSA
jgi:hypothetical protein